MAYWRASPDKGRDDQINRRRVPALRQQARGIHDPQLLKTTNGIRISRACAPVMARAFGCALLFDIVNVQKLDARSCNRLRLDRRMLSGSAVHLSICAIGSL